MRGVRTNDSAAIDEKGRVNLPHRLRVRLEADACRTLVLHYFRGAVWGWLPEQFEEHVEREVAEAGHLSAEGMARAHAWLGTADTVEIDQAGRIRLSPELRELAGLTKEVRILSVLDRVELWSPERWRARFAEATSVADGAPQVAA